MVRNRSATIIMLASLAVLLTMQASAVSARDPKILEFDGRPG